MMWFRTATVRIQAFWERVTGDIAPGYYSIIKEPMWLRKMFDKCKSRSYKKMAEFWDDMALIVRNCKTYNSALGPSGWLRQRADELYAETEELVADVQQEIDALEANVLTYAVKNSRR
eukprot:GHVT01063545.1.p1 GENE.GHVT01063545.1~~GHVT01063545.1.p1  ORF type:complete len:118 (+),score=0.16 GHVT01063545.1:344-697(+)